MIDFTKLACELSADLAGTLCPVERVEKALRQLAADVLNDAAPECECDADDQMLRTRAAELVKP
jgi:hypothetical protein